MVTVVLPVGLGVAGVAISTVNSGRISELKNIVDADHNTTEFINTRLQLIEKYVEDLVQNFNAGLAKMDITDINLNELKAKLVSSTFAISFITSRLMFAKQVMQEAIDNGA